MADFLRLDDARPRFINLDAIADIQAEPYSYTTRGRAFHLDSLRVTFVGDRIERFHGEYAARIFQALGMPERAERIREVELAALHAVQ